MTPDDDATSPPDVPVKKALARLVKDGAAELADVRQRVRQRQEEIKQRGEAIKDDIRRGVRPRGKQFRL